jgi:hypothetical protein
MLEDLSPTKLYEHAKEFTKHIGVELGSGEHVVVEKFCKFLEGKHLEQDAIDLLESKGYTVTQPTPKP